MADHRTSAGGARPGGLTRRELLIASGIGAGAAFGLGEIAGPASAAGSASADSMSWPAVRAAFPLRRDRLHFTSFLLSPHPKPVARAIERFRRGIDPDPEGYLSDHQAANEDRVQRAAAHYLGAGRDEIALTDSTTMGLGLLYGGVRLAPGDEIVTSTHDFYSTHEALRLRAQRVGATLQKVRLYKDPANASADEIASAVAPALTTRTRVLALTWVHSSTGVKLPITEIAGIVRSANRGRRESERVLFCLDGVHGFGNQDADAAGLGCDFLVTGCHKWLFGPRGTGLVWGRPEAWNRVSATVPSFDGRSIGTWINPSSGGTVPAGARMTPGGFHSFEHRWALSDAFAFHEAIGRGRVAARTRALAAQLKEGLARMPNVTLRTPRAGALSAGLVCFEVDNLEAPAAVEELKRSRVLASVTPYAVRYVRLGPSIVNTPEEVDAALRAIRKL